MVYVLLEHTTTPMEEQGVSSGMGLGVFLQEAGARLDATGVEPIMPSVHTDPLHAATAPAIQPRPYQTEALEAIAVAEREGVRRPLVVLPTGTGKTIIFARLLAQRSGRALILAHRDELISQAVDKLRLVLGGDAPLGIVKAERNDVGAPLVVASVQTLARSSRLTQLVPDFTTIIIDEAHHAPADSYRRVLEHLGAFRLDGPLTLGVTATADRHDGIGLGRVFEAVVFERSLLAMMQAGYLCDLRAIQVAVGVDLDQVEYRAGDWTESGLERALLAAEVPRHVADVYQQHAPGRRALCFTPTVKLTHLVAGACRAAGLRAEAVDGGTPLEERRAILARYARGQTDLLVNCGVLLEGYDDPPTDAIIIARPTHSRALYTQMVGRGTRRYPGKTDCLILDLVGASTRHQLVTIASLLDLPTDRVAAVGVLEAATEQARARQQRDLVRTTVMATRPVDLFAAARVRWVPADGGYVLTCGADYLRLEPAGTAWQLIRQTRQGRLVLQRGLSLEYAMGVAEDLARQAGAGVLVDARAPWRREPPSAKQAAVLARYGEPVPATRGEAADVLTALFAQRRRGRRVWAPPPP
jgi:ATP-dependent helicase IRC3